MSMLETQILVMRELGLAPKLIDEFISHCLPLEDIFDNRTLSIKSIQAVVYSTIMSVLVEKENESHECFKEGFKNGVGQIIGGN